MDRNASITTYVSCARQSLSARRAWIEIIHRGPHHFYLGVALRKESVDRNNLLLQVCRPNVPSLSARRAWIEIQIVSKRATPAKRRSPQGERG